MHIYEVTDPEFRKYGKVLEGLETGELLKAMKEIPYPEEGVSYEAGIPSLEGIKKLYSRLESSCYGGMPIQVGMCWGHNTRLNCLEYHRDSEVNIGDVDFVLLVAREDEMDDGRLDTSKVKAFHVGAGVPVEIFATTLHYAPCQYCRAQGFRVAVVLPRGTNTACPEFERKTYEDSLMTARNKWLLAHEDSVEAGNGAVVALTGINIDISDSID